MTTSEKIDAARSRVNTRAFDQFMDDKRRAFLDKLHVAAQDVEVKQGDVAVIKRARIRLTDWEQHFVADLVIEPRSFTDAQRDKIDELRRQHERRLC